MKKEIYNFFGLCIFLRAFESKNQSISTLIKNGMGNLTHISDLLGCIFNLTRYSILFDKKIYYNWNNLCSKI